MDFISASFSSASTERYYQVAVGADIPWNFESLLIVPKTESMTVAVYAECQATKAFLGCENLPYQVKECWNAEEMSLGNQLPLLVSGKHMASGFEAISAFARKSVRRSLSNDILSQTRPYMTVINKALRSAELYLTWINSANYQRFAKPRVGSIYSFPLTQVIPLLKWWQIYSLLRASDWLRKSETDVVKEADECLRALSEKLGDKGKFAESETPTELDCLVYGHVQAINSMSMPNDSLRQNLQKYPNLLQFAAGLDVFYRENIDIKPE